MTTIPASEIVAVNPSVLGAGGSALDMIGLMLTTMMVMLGSFRRLAMVVAVLPLGLIGVVLSLLLFNRPLGFVAILGVLALIVLY